MLFSPKQTVLGTACHSLVTDYINETAVRLQAKARDLLLLRVGLSMMRTCCRGTLLPDPRYDALRCIVLAAADDAEDMSDGNYTARVLLFHDKTTSLREGLPNVQVSRIDTF